MFLYYYSPKTDVWSVMQKEDASVFSHCTCGVGLIRAVLCAHLAIHVKYLLPQAAINIVVSE
ncbi:hypothetical protein GQ55_2G303300 [Panicum hallii var. hallii]|uniref:Uncharacterized protein n=1 Tax=Panicum hallii var. hallii TaxID=1504633 RepID=A0A2T7ETZ3_9POAL|nr:hypothetical protein GQ55_2G303300 [Panicum hallii var. hallii]